MHLKAQADVVIHAVLNWARTKKDISGVLLVGSYARGEEKPNSDIDFIFLVKDRENFLENSSWINEINLGIINSISDQEEWGVVTSFRVILDSKVELELSIARLKWASITPIDSGTKNVLKNGAKILWDPKKILTKLFQECDAFCESCRQIKNSQSNGHSNLCRIGPQTDVKSSNSPIVFIQIWQCNKCGIEWSSNSYPNDGVTAWRVCNR